MRIKDICEQANKAPIERRAPKWLRILVLKAERFWGVRFPGVKKAKSFEPRMELDIETK